MLSDIFKNKNRLMVAFLLRPLKIFSISFLVALIILIFLSLIARKGDFSIGTSFVEWYSSVTDIESTNGMFPADSFKGCWSCAIFSKIFDLMSLVGLKIFVFISDIVWTLVVMGLAVWILAKVYNYIKDEQKNDFREVLKELVKKLVIISCIGVAIGYAKPDHLKSMANLIFENTAIPVMEMGVGVGTEIIKSPICNHLTYPKSEVDGILSPELKNNLLCLVNSVNVVYLSAMTAGSNMVDFALGSFLKKPASILDVIGGMAMTAIFMILYVYIPFVLVDIIFTVGLLIAFTPIMIGGYAYNETKNFSNTAFKSLFGMAFYIIMFCIFLGIIYSSFIFIGDAYYPAPVDNFTYLFPDFIYNDMVASQTDTLMKSETFAKCFESANGDVSKVQKCLRAKDILFEMPTIGDTGGSFLPIFSLGMLSLMIMGNLQNYAGLVSGYMFKVGDAFRKMIQSSFKWALSATKKEAKYIKGETLDKIFDVNKLKKDSQALDEKLKENT